MDRSPSLNEVTVGARESERFLDCLLFVTVSQEKFMALRLEDKKTFVKEVNAVAGDSVTAIAAEYRGLSVAEMTELRREARSAGVYLRVVKNTLGRRAIEGTEFECMKDTLKGPLLLAFAKRPYEKRPRRTALKSRVGRNLLYTT